VIAGHGHVGLCQLKVMRAIESCRTAALGGHVACCDDCSYTTIAYNSCRNRHCPKCQGAAAREWLAEREAELLPVPYFHVVFTLPARIVAIAYQNKAVVYDLLFKASSEAVLTIAADPEVATSVACQGRHSRKNVQWSGHLFRFLDLGVGDWPLPEDEDGGVLIPGAGPVHLLA
jgi:hypothetical protein